MTKNNIEIFNKIKNSELDYSKEQLSFIEELLSKATKKATKIEENPDYTKDGVDYHYCIGHQRYEKSSGFIEIKGKLKPNCIIATQQWNVITKELNKAKEELLNANSKTFKDIQAKVKKLDKDRQGPFDIEGA